MSQEGIMKEEQAAEYLNVSRNYLRRCRMKELRHLFESVPPYVRIGRTIRYLKADLDAWLDGLRVTDK